MKKLLLLFIISMCQLAMSAQETYTVTYATDTHTLYLESSVMGDFQANISLTTAPIPATT